VTLEKRPRLQRYAAHITSMLCGVVVEHVCDQPLGSVERLPTVLAREHIDAIGVLRTPVRMEIAARSIREGA
jgi:hypothetical protein